MRRRRAAGGGGRWVAVVGLAMVVAATLTACGSRSETPQAALSGFLLAWNNGDWGAMAAAVDDPADDFAASGPRITAGLGATDAIHTLATVTSKGADATASIESRYLLPGVGTWAVPTTLALVKHSGRWLVQWSPTAIDPVLRSGEHLQLTHTWAPRAAILGLGGVPLTMQGAMVVVGIEGSRVTNTVAVAAALKAAGATPAQVQAAMTAAVAHPTYFEPVFTITEIRFAQLGGQDSALYRIAGTVFQHTTARSAVTAGLEAHLVGSVGPVTAEELRQLGPSYDATSVVGQSGLEAAYQSRLVGQPGGTITAVTSDGKIAATVATFAPRPGTAVQTSIDPTVQQAAEAALAPLSHYAALVAVRASTGQILASVSVPGAYQFDQALGGEFPPGSTFKIITSTALIEKGLSPSSPASCPPETTVDGEVFHNAEGDAPTDDLQGAFTESCNTAFIGLATANLQSASLPAAARQYGIGVTPTIGVAAFGGRVPTPADGAALAQTAIGQAQVVVSPLNMAMVAAAVDTGVVRAPRLVVGAAGDSTPSHPLAPAVTAALQQMMAEVVTSGTAAGTGLPAGTHAKTGTAEYGSGVPQPTDAWLVGYRGDVAFAMVLQGTGNGGPTDGPIVARFLQALSPGT